MHRSRRFSLLGAAAIFVLTTFLVPTLQAQPGSLDDPLPKDPAVRMGVLDNGLTYMIRQNNKPENRAGVRLAVRAGSILEDDDQRGLAHFVEHMAFNGTENFEGNAVVSYLEDIGMRFGAHLNAFTSFDQTVYMLRMPIEDDALAKGMLILHDWAGGILFEEKAIDDERGVVIEEMRARDNGDARVGVAHFERLNAGNKYAVRRPIGTKEVLVEAPHDRFRRFYRDWYRPDLMAIVAVGDFDVDEVEQMIKDQFSGLKSPANPRERTIYEIEPYDGTRYSIAFDPEASVPSVGINYVYGTASRGTFRDYRRQLIDGAISGMLNQRFAEATRDPESPLLGARGGIGIGSANSRVFNLGGSVKGGDYASALEMLLVELERVRQHGFTQSELDRQVRTMLTSIDASFAESDKTESGSYAREYYSHFTTGESFPGIAVERDMYHGFLPSLSLAEVNDHAAALIIEDGRGISVGGPEDEASADFSESDIDRVLDRVLEMVIEPYEEEAVSGELMAGRPAGGSVVDTETINELGVTVWQLSNGVRVVLKPTDFKNDEIFLSASSPGGTSLIPDNDIVPATVAAAIVREGGIGPFDQTALRRYLSDKNVGVNAGIGEHFETINGQSTVADLETLFQLVYLGFTEPRKDREAFEVFASRVRSQLENSGSRPESVWSDTVNHVMSGYHPRSQPWTPETVDAFDLDKSFAIFLDRFVEAGDFTFVLVGSFDLAEIRPLVTSYLGGLPTQDRDEMWRDVGSRTPTGEVKRIVYKGVEPKSVVRLTYHGDLEQKYENRWRLRTMTEVMLMKVREQLRENKGGVYSPNVWTTNSAQPNGEYFINVQFSCDPERVDELIADVHDIVADLQKNTVEESYVEKVREIQLKQRESSLEENRTWISLLNYYYQQGEDPLTINLPDQLIPTISTAMVRDAAREFLGTKNRMTFILMPEGS